MDLAIKIKSAMALLFAGRSPSGRSSFYRRIESGSTSTE